MKRSAAKKKKEKKKMKRMRRSVACRGRMHAHEAKQLIHTARISMKDVLMAPPAPRSGALVVDASNGCVLAEANGRDALLDALGEYRQTAHFAAGKRSPVDVYVSLEPRSCTGCDEALRSLVSLAPRSVFVGLAHPARGECGRAMRVLASSGISRVEVAERNDAGPDECAAAASCYDTNEALVVRCSLGAPLSLLKYAMTLDGRIAASSGHSSWVSGRESRELVHRIRAASDAVIVGGETLRRDDPRLTVRLDEPCAARPLRVVLSRSMQLPREARLWDVAAAPTIVITEEGAARGDRIEQNRRDELERALRRRGVEVVALPAPLSPRVVLDYCHMRGFMQCLWECGGKLAAPALKEGAVHKVFAFMAPKLVGGVDDMNAVGDAGLSTPGGGGGVEGRQPDVHHEPAKRATRTHAPVGDMGVDDMRNAMSLHRVRYRQVGEDMLTTGYVGDAVPERLASRPSLWEQRLEWSMDASRSDDTAGSRSIGGSRGGGRGGRVSSRPIGASNNAGMTSPPTPRVARFYKPWDEFGCLSNFSRHSIEIESRRWPSVEHYYQAAKFDDGRRHPYAAKIRESIAESVAPEAAARRGRAYERACPHLVRSDWSAVKKDVMLRALRVKFETHEDCRAVLHGTNHAKILETSPNDYFWGIGYDFSGKNVLGELLMQIRGELTAHGGCDADTDAVEAGDDRDQNDEDANEGDNGGEPNPAREHVVRA